MQGSKSLPFPILFFPPANLSACLETSFAGMQNHPDATLARMEKDGAGGMGEHLQERSHIVVTRDRRSQINFLLQECEPSAFFLLYAAWVRSRAERPSVSYTKVVMGVAWTGHNLQFTKTN